MAAAAAEEWRANRRRHEASQPSQEKQQALLLQQRPPPFVAAPDPAPGSIVCKSAAHYGGGRATHVFFVGCVHLCFGDGGVRAQIVQDAWIVHLDGLIILDRQLHQAGRLHQETALLECRPKAAPFA